MRNYWKVSRTVDGVEATTLGEFPTLQDAKACVSVRKNLFPDHSDGLVIIYLGDQEVEV